MPQTVVKYGDLINRRDAVDPDMKGQVNFLKRLKLSFGDEIAQKEADELEKRAGLKDKLDVGDFADILGDALPFIGGVGGSFVAPIAGTAAGAAAGESLKRGIGHLLGVRSSVAEQGVGKGLAEELIGVGTVGTVTGATAGLARFVGSGASKFVKFPLKQKAAGEVLLGTKGLDSARRSFRNPQSVRAFMTGQRSVQNVADDTTGAIDALRGQSIEVFRQAETRLISKTIDPKIVRGEIDSLVRKNFGLPKQGQLSFAETGLSEAEERLLGRLVTKINKWEDTSLKGIVKLRRSIDDGKFFKGNDDFATSDRVVSMIRKRLNAFVNENDPAFAKATAQAAKDIELLNKLQFNVVGRSRFSVEQTATKLNSLANKLADPTQRRATVSIVNELEKRTGVALLDQLEDLVAARVLTQTVPGIIESPLRTANQLFVRGINATARGAGRFSQTGREVRSRFNLPPVEGLFGAGVGAFESEQLQSGETEELIEPLSAGDDFTRDDLSSLLQSSAFLAVGSVTKTKLPFKEAFRNGIANERHFKPVLDGLSKVITGNFKPVEKQIAFDLFGAVSNFEKFNRNVTRQVKLNKKEQEFVLRAVNEAKLFLREVKDNKITVEALKLKKIQ